MKNPFTAGDKVVCINTNFPWIEKYGGTPSYVHPKKDEVLIVDETLGEYLRFAKYDTETETNWWYYDRFAPVDDTEAYADTAVAEFIEETFNEPILI